MTAASPGVEPAALPRTVLDRIRSGNLGSWPVIIALAIRPHGLFGTAAVQKV